MYTGWTLQLSKKVADTTIVLLLDFCHTALQLLFVIETKGNSVLQQNALCFSTNSPTQECFTFYWPIVTLQNRPYEL